MQCSLDPMIINKIMFPLQVGWQSLVVLYEHDESLTRLQELLRLPQVAYFLCFSERPDFPRLNYFAFCNVSSFLAGMMRFKFRIGF